MGLSVLLLITVLMISAGCVTSQQGRDQVSQQIANPTPLSTLTPVPVQSDRSTAPRVDQSAPVTSMKAEVTQASSPVPSPSPLMERAPDMDGFISTSFPKVTDVYTEIQQSRNALEWKAVQDQALSLQILVQDLKKTYQLEVPNPEKTVFPGLDSRQQIVFLKYLQYLNDMENFATNLKNAVYYQEKGSDPQSSQTARRYQNQADQFEKQAIAEVKTISDYCNDFRYTFLNPVTVQKYRYVE